MQETNSNMEALIKLLDYLRGLKIEYAYDTYDDGSISCWTESPHVLASDAPTLDEGIAQLPELLRQWAYYYVNDCEHTIKEWPDELPYAIKILLCSNEEIKSCLRCDAWAGGIPF